MSKSCYDAFIAADITKNVLKENSKAFTQVFDHAKKTLEKVQKH